jgi:hypothetical protein
VLQHLCEPAGALPQLRLCCIELLLHCLSCYVHQLGLRPVGPKRRPKGTEGPQRHTRHTIHQHLTQGVHCQQRHSLMVGSVPMPHPWHD